MKIIISSIGRAGSTLICDLIAASLETESIFVTRFRNIGRSHAVVVKTHDHFLFEPDYEYRAVFLADRIENIIASLYPKNKHFLSLHLRHLRVRLFSRIVFKILMKLDHVCGKGYFRRRAFAYMIKDDKFGFKRNITSWKKARHARFVDYNRLCSHKSEVLQTISGFVGFSVKDFEVKTRTTTPDALPGSLRNLIDTHYAHFEQMYNDS